VNERDIAAYVDTACALQGIELAADERARVVDHFARILVIATPLIELELPDSVELAPVFEP